MTDEERKARVAELYTQLDATIRELTTLDVVREGLVTDWMVITAIQKFDDDGDVLSTVEPLLPDAGRSVPRYRSFGLLKDMMTQYEAVAGHMTLVSLHQALEDDDE